MATDPTPPPPGAAAPPAPRLGALLARRKEFRVALFAAAAGLSAIPIALAADHGLRDAAGPVFFWGAALALVTLGVALYDLAAPRGGRPGELLEGLRLELLALGGLAGLATALLGFFLPLSPAYREKIAGGLESWQKNYEALLLPALALLGGLALMFFSLQLARGMERTSPRLRVLVYGYNAVLSSLLLLGVLAIPNVLAYASPFDRWFFDHTYDWTASRFNTLQDETRNLLSDLKEPVKVYVLLPRGPFVTQDTLVMLENCRGVTDKLSYQLVSRDSSPSRDDLMEKYNLTESTGLLVVVGTEPKVAHEFIKVNDLAPQGWGGTGYAYAGENALVNALTYLIEGKVVYYFTQGSGELELNPPAGRRPNDPGLSDLRSRLTNRKGVEVKELKLGPDGVQRVPADASLVVVARPTRTMPADAVNALREYMRGTSGKKGKLMVLLDPVVGVKESKAFIPTGLEALLAEHNVRVGNDIVLTVQVDPDKPTQVLAITNPRSENPIAKAFFPNPLQRTIFTFTNVRTVSPAERGPEGGTTAEPLMYVTPDQEIRAETDPNRDPRAWAARIREDRALARKELSPRPLSIAVAVAESSGGGMPRDPAHAGLLKETPRLVVFGNADWIDDQGLRTRSNYDLFVSCLAWLRERPTVGKTVPPVSRKVYDLNVRGRDNQTRLLYLPLGLMVLAVVGVGCGVWVVRRR